MKDNRILFKTFARRRVFHDLKKFHNVKTFRELSIKLGVSYNTLKDWINGEYSTPSKIFPKLLLRKDLIDDIKPENWGQVKGGKIGIRKMFDKYPKEIRRKWSIKGGNNNKENLKRIREEYKELINKKSKETKIRKQYEKILSKINLSNNFFCDDYPQLSNEIIEKSYRDIKDDIRFPKILDEALAEEIGLHIGDGTLLLPRNYFALRGYARDEYEYYKNYISKLYKNIYNFNPKIFTRGSICGFEKCSRAIFSFKNKIIGLPHGKKSYDVDIPEIVKKSRNEKLIAACIRGILDSDGCIWFSKNGKYPRIEISSKSKRLIRSIGFYLDKMGFQPNLQYDDTKIVLNGEVMLNLWMEKIGTNHPKHKLKVDIWKKFGSCPPKLSYNQLEQISLNNALVV
ncbi:hypothetical protein A3K64_02425 [Candidatus Micrarchaeota archaeon RBG_16_36_9]|nr:MAG: hypothetical protein A3K64_02425 [Candidatus Micrarchaeota archaeon RBG_16_36_9]